MTDAKRIAEKITLLKQREREVEDLQAELRELGWQGGSSVHSGLCAIDPGGPGVSCLAGQTLEACGGNCGKQALGDAAENDALGEPVSFSLLFDMHEVQLLQDSIAYAFDIMSVITDADGKHLTQVSNLRQLCSKDDCPLPGAYSACSAERVALLRGNAFVPQTGRCRCGLLLEGGVGVYVGEVLLGYWLFGHVRSDEDDAATVQDKLQKRGGDIEHCRALLDAIPVMSDVKFVHVADVIFKTASQLSSMAVRSLELYRSLQERERAFGERERAIRMMKTVIEQAPFGVVVAEGTADDWAVTDTNPEAVKLVGDGVDFVGVGIKNNKAVGPRSLELQITEEGVQEFSLRHAPLVRAMTRGEATRSAEITLTHKDGRRYVVLGNCAPVRGGDGDVVGSVAVFQDITDRIAEEEALKEREALYRSLFEETVSGIYIWDAERKLMAANPAACEMHRFAQTEILGKTPYDLFSTSEVQHRFHAALIRGEDYRGHSSGIRADGSMFEAEVSVRVLSVTGQQHVFCVVQDISRRKERERQLALTQFGVDNASVGITRVNKDGELLYANKEFSEMTGYSLEDLRGMHTWDFTEDVTQEKWGERWERMRRDKQFVVFRDYRKKDGTTFPVYIQAHYIVWGKEAFAFAFITDLSRQEAVERALHESEAQYRTLFDSAIEGLIVFNPAEDKLVAVNEACAAMHGYAVEEFMQLHPKEMAVDPSIFFEVVNVLRNGGDYFGETQGKHRNGNVLDIELRGRSITIDGLEHYLVSLRDITEQKSAQAEIANLRVLLTSMINALPSAMIALDSEANVMRWNRSAEQMTGHSADAAVGEYFFDLVELPDEGAALVRRVLMDRISGEVLAMPILLEGENAFVDLTVFPLTVGETAGVVVRVDNVTERVKLDEVMVQAEKMLSVGGLAAGMAHEINNPLGGILQGVQNIQRRLSAELPANVETAVNLGCTLEQVRKYLEERKILRMLEGIRDSGDRAAKIVSNMLDFARKSNQECISCNLRALVEATIEIAATDYDIKKTYDFKHINVETSIADDLPELPCYESELGQVLLNLLRNAAQAHYDSGTQAPGIIVRVYKGGLGIVMEVEDNGPGMPDDVRKRVFEPFYTTKPPGVGTGLGLAVSYFIITQNHGGSFAVDSELGRGTRFTIQLPLTGAEGRVASLKE